MDVDLDPDQARNIIQYLRECYREDHSRPSLWNIFSPDVEHLLFPHGDEHLITEVSDTAVIDPGPASDALKHAQLYARETELIYGSIFVLGKTSVPSKKQQSVTLCAPILIFPAAIELTDNSGEDAEGFYLLSIDPGGVRINQSLLRVIAEEGGDDALCDSVQTIVGDGPINELSVSAIARAIRTHTASSVTDPVDVFPQLLNKSDLNRRAKAVAESGERTFEVVSASAAGIIKRSFASRGVIDELSTLAEEDTALSPAARTLLGPALDRRTDDDPAEQKPLLVPTALTKAQEDIVRSARDYPLTLAIGPPGTGKSYTVASIALEHACRGESVLIASKKSQAVDVAGQKIEEAVGDSLAMVRGGRREHRKKLRNFIDNLLMGYYLGEPVTAEELERNRREIMGLREDVAEYERWLVERHASEIKNGLYLANGPPDNVWGRFRTWLIKRRSRKEPTLWRVVDKLDEFASSFHRRMTGYLQKMRRFRLQRAYYDHRDELKQFQTALRARTSGRQLEAFGKLNMKTLLDVVPIWLVDLEDVHSILPLQSELFDVAIIDEASQCELASALPLAHRARRLVVAGDPKQLRHICFLSRRRQQILAEQFHLPPDTISRFDYRATSLADHAGRQTTSRHIGFLDEHFRSHPDIISFSNDRFYDNRLRIISELRHMNSDSGRGDGLIMQHVPGTRDQSGVNHAEAEKIVEFIQKFTAGGTNHGGSATIGVLSPFRAQVDYIRDALSAQLTGEQFGKLSEECQLRVDTAHGFQGEERDIMLISLCLDGSSGAHALRFLEREDVFNVSITRARNQQRVFHSMAPASLPENSLLRQFLQRSTNELNQRKPQYETRCAFAREVADWMRTENAEITIGAMIAGIEVDILARFENRYLGIDIIGYPGEFVDAFPVHRSRILARAGLPIFPIPYTRWSLEPEECQQVVIKTFHRLRRG